jgi:hypothetical protein
MSCTFFLSSLTRNSRIRLERQCPVDLRELVLIYIYPLGYILEAFKVSMLILLQNPPYYQKDFAIFVTGR